MILQIFFRTVISHLPGSLGHFADCCSVPKSLTTTFHLILTAAILLKHLLLFVERLFQRCHLSRIDEVLKFDDSMIDLHLLSQIPSKYTTFGLCDGSKNFNKFFPSHVKMLFCTDKIESIEWPRSCTTTAYRWLSLDSHPSLGTSWSAVIKSPNFSARSRASRVRLLQRALCYFGSQADVAVSVFREVRKDAVLPNFCYHFRRTFQVWFPRTVCKCRHFCVYQVYLGNPLTDRPHLSCHPSEIPSPVSWWLVRHFAQILNLKMSLLPLCFQRLEID